MPFVEGQFEHRRSRLHAHIDAGPAIAAVPAVQQHAGIALKIGAGGNPDLARIAGYLADVAAIDLVLGVERFQRHVFPMIARVGAAKHPGPADGIDRARPPAACHHAVHVDGIVVDILAVAEVLPAPAAIGRADDAADLDRAVQQVGVGRAGGQHQDPLDRIGAGRGRDLGKFDGDRQTLPAFAAILAAVDFTVFVSDEDHVGIARMEQDRPDRLTAVGDVYLLPTIAIAVAAVGAVLCAGVDDAWPIGMNRECADLGCLGQPVIQPFPVLAAVGEAIEARVYGPVRGGFTAHADKDESTIRSTACHDASFPR